MSRRASGLQHRYRALMYSHDIAQHAEARLNLARDVIAPRVRELTLRWFQSPDLRPERKSDGSVVTPVDREAEDMIREIIAREFPDDAILGEERGAFSPSAEPTSPWRWVLDPIDGTGSYVRGLPHWVLLIGIEYANDPVAGLIDCPAVNETLWALRGVGASWRLRNGETRPARVSTVSDLRRAMIELAPWQWFAQADLAPVHARLCTATRRNRGWSDGYAFALLATGRVDAAVNFGFHRWDLSGPAIVIAEAGGRVTGWGGGSALDARHVLASNALLHDALLDLLRE